MNAILRFALLLLLAAAGTATAAPEAARTVLTGHTVAAIAEAGSAAILPKAADADSAPVALTVVMRLSDRAALDRLLAELYTQGSSSYGKFLTPREAADRFAPTANDYRRVAQWFATQGFAVTADTPNRMTMTLAGSRAQVERAFDVALVDYNIQGKRVFANDREPSLPVEIAQHIEAIAGLSDLAQARSVSDGLVIANAWKYCVDQQGATPIVGDFCRLMYKAAASIYNVLCAFLWNWFGSCKPLPVSDAAPNGGRVGTTVNGAGQTVGIVALDTYRASDVTDFVALMGAPATQAAQVSLVNINGGAPLGPTQAEVLLDIGTVMTVAPAASIVVYSAPFAGAGTFQTILNRMLTDGVGIITNSYAYCENQTTFADVSSIDAIVALAAASGVTVVSASGDTGSTCLNGSPNTIAVPASAPHITAVGGTSITFGPGGIYLGETWWDGSASTPRTGQGGFGVSRFFPRPAWQSALTTSATRSIPDISLNADPAANGVPICAADLGGCPTQGLYGGTSYSAPLLAGFVALLNESRGARLGWLNPQLYPLAGTQAFHTPASMGSDFAHVGLGSPNGSLLALALRGGSVGPPTAANSLVLATNPTLAADGVDSVNVIVQLRDANLTTVAGKTVTLAATPSTGVTITPASAVTNLGNGATVFTVRRTTTGAFTLSATDVTDGIALTMTASITAVVPPAAAGSIQAFPTTVANDGVATTTITVTLQDANGQPTPGKSVLLAQGGGRSVITAPTPPVTAANGQIQFTATNLHAESVTYTAVVVTDGNVPVPGNAVVTYSGSAPTSCVTGPAPTAAAGYAITPFATGFLAGAFNYSNVNWGCAGASNPAFNPIGDVLIANFRTGALYRLPPAGGAASSGNIIATPGLTIGQPVYGRDGRLYALRSATGSGFFSGAIYELDPASGAIVRTLASGLACVSPLSVDPISGDLFFTGTCFGAGSDDPNLYRVVNPGSATPAVQSYATLPGTPNGAISFAPDGTMYIATQYLLAAPPVVRVSGTNQPQPPTITPITGLASIFWVTVAETLPSGAAKSLVFLATDNTMKLADVSVAPPAITPLIDRPMSSGVIGPDGCLYLSNSETVFKLTQANGACGFTPTNPVPAISLTPAITSPDPPQGTSATLTATLVGVAPTPGVPVLFEIVGANTQARVVSTNAQGKAILAYDGLNTGSDVIRARATLGATALASNAARITWTAGRHIAAVSLNVAPISAIAATPVTLSADLIDASVAPQAAIAGASLQFTVAGQSCSAATNASGIASCAVTIPLAGTYTLTVSYGGNATFTPDTDARLFTVVAAPPGPCVAFNDVDVTSPFCPNVEWIKNRAITLGCLATLYCPDDRATRLQMAAFMNRLGSALSPRVLFVATTTGPLDLDADPVVCATADFATGVFARRALVDATFSASAAADTGFAADPVASFDGGATWLPLAPIGHRGFAAAAHWGEVRAGVSADLTAAQTVRFGLWISRGGLPGITDLADGRCQLRAAIGNR